MRNFVFDASLTAVIMLSALCISLPTAKAEAILLNWTSPTKAGLNSVYMVSTTDAWAVGSYWGSGGVNESIIHWDGSNWSNVTGPQKHGLSSVFMVSANDGWAVGDSGTIIRWTGVMWVSEFPVTALLPLLITASMAAVFARTMLRKREK